jgi:dUTP pyrophosphatase
VFVIDDNANKVNLGIAPATDGSAGYDLTATSINIEQEFIEYGTNIGFDIPKGTVGFIFSRSSVSAKSMVLCNSVGVIDSDYRGEIRFRFKRLPQVLPYEFQAEKTFSDSQQKDSLNIYKVGDVVGQIVFIEYQTFDFVVVDKAESQKTERGAGGFGSTDQHAMPKVVNFTVEQNKILDQVSKTEGEVIFSTEQNLGKGKKSK